MWKNSTWVCCFSARNCTSSMSSTSLLRYCCLKPSMRPFSVHCVDEVVGELLDGHVAHLEARVGGRDLVRDGVHEVGLAETRVGVDEDRVVGGRRGLGDAARDGRRIFVVRADDPAVEGVARVESGGAGGGGDRRRLRRRPSSAGFGRGVGRRRCRRSRRRPRRRRCGSRCRVPITAVRASRSTSSKRESIQSLAKSLGTPITNTPSSRPSGSVRSNQRR